MLVEESGTPPLFNDANEALMCQFADYTSGHFDPVRDCDIVSELIIGIHRLDNARRRRLYGKANGDD